MAETGITEKCTYQTPEEVAQLPVFTEPVASGDEVDGPRSAEGYVYLIWPSNSYTCFKVGLTGNPNGRLQQLQSANPYELIPTFARVSNMQEAENALKRIMKQHFRFDLGGGTEWFETEPGRKELVERLFWNTVKQYQ